MTCSMGKNKIHFKLKYKLSEGNILQVHHTLCTFRGEERKIRFLSVVFDFNDHRFACSDHCGNIFIFDLRYTNYWPLSGCVSSCVLSFHPWKPSVLLLATMNCPFEVLLVDYESGKIRDTLDGHTLRVKIGSFSSSRDLFITASDAEALIWELQKYTLRFKINVMKGKLRDIAFVPVFNYITACFQNDIMQIWDSKTFNRLDIDLPEEFNFVKSFVFTKNGKLTILATYDNISVYDTENWHCIQHVELKKVKMKEIKQMCFLNQTKEDNGMILAILSKDCVINIIDLDNLHLIYTLPMEDSNFYKIVSSPNGKYLTCILHLGEINVFDSCTLIKYLTLSSIKKIPFQKSKCPITNEGDVQSKGTISTIQHLEMGDTDTFSKEYCFVVLPKGGSYPEEERLSIWKHLLHIPENRTAFNVLLQKPLHSYFINIEEEFLFYDDSLIMYAKVIFSLLQYWHPAIGSWKYMMAFVLPFVKIIYCDPLICFEVITTFFINNYRIWFDNRMSTPNVDILNLIENILGKFDTILYSHFLTLGLSCDVFGFSLIKSGFSEVLTRSEWLKIWDHILSNEPGFIIFAVVAFNIVHKDELLKLIDCQKLICFYSKLQNNNMNEFIDMCYYLLQNTPQCIHPKIYFNKFKPIEKNVIYQPLEYYVNGNQSANMRCR